MSKSVTVYLERFFFPKKRSMAPYPYQHLRMLWKSVTYTAGERGGGSGENVSHGSVATNKALF